MNAIRKTLIIGFATFSYLFCKGQVVQVTPLQQLGEHKKQIGITQYIFEGTVTQENHNTEKKQLITTSIIEITKIYKGSPQIKLGSIKVITWHELKNAITSDQQDMVEIHKGNTYILFGRITSSVDSTKTDNAITLTSWGMDYPILISEKDSANWKNTPQFKTVDDIETFFNENGVMIQEEVKDDNSKH